MKKPRVIVNGAFGRMGRLACDVIQACDDLELIAQCGRCDNLSAAIQEQRADMVVDFTLAESVYPNLLTIIAAGARPIIGTSGLTAEQIAHGHELLIQKKHGGLVVPNFSLGAVLMMQCAEKAARYFHDVEIIETHHEKKVDAPSGTAIKTAEIIRDQQILPSLRELTKTETLPHARGAKLENIHIHSLRLPGVLAKQIVTFGNPGETLAIEHNVLDRQAYVPGLLMACRAVMNLHGLMYGLEEVL